MRSLPNDYLERAYAAVLGKAAEVAVNSERKAAAKA